MQRIVLIEPDLALRRWCRLHLESQLTGSEAGLVGYWRLDAPQAAADAQTSVAGGGALTFVGPVAPADSRAFSQTHGPYNIEVSDLENDHLTLSAQSSDSNVAATITGTQLFLTPSAGFSGTARITITASDGQGQSGEGLTGDSRGRIATMSFDFTTGDNAIYGTKWNDLNGDGIHQEGEPALDGVPVFLDQHGNGVLDPGEPSTITDANGEYAFRGLPAAPATTAVVTAPSGPSSSDGEVRQTVTSTSVFIPFFGTIPETVTTTTEANFDLLFDRRLFSFTLTPSMTADNKTPQDLVADLNLLLTQVGLGGQVAAGLSGGDLSFATVAAGKEQSLRVDASLHTHILTHPSFILSDSTQDSDAPGALGFAVTLSGVGSDHPYVVAEVPFPGWAPTTGAKVVNGFPLGEQTVQFSYAGQIHPGANFGNVHVVDLSLGSEQTVNEGSLVTLTPTVNDPKHREGDPFTYAWHVVTPDNGDVIPDGTTRDFSFTPANNGIYRVQLVVTDTQSGSEAYPFNLPITVLNVKPTVALVADKTINEGQTLSVSTTFTDPGIKDVHAATIDWGDGTTGVGTVTESNGAGTVVSGSHKYAEHKDYDVTILVKDDDGAIGETHLEAHVLNVAPSLTLSGASKAVENTPYALTLSSLDPGADEAISHWDIQWGDGSAQDVLGNPSSVTHTFTAGGKSFAIIATATDQDGTWTANTLSVAVSHGFLGVEALIKTDTGFRLEFNRVFDPSKINIYGSQTGGEGAADVTLFGAKTGAVSGSLVLDGDDKGFTFIRTGGPLPADTYTVTLASRADGFVDTLGRPLDGNDDDDNGDNYTGSFVVAASTTPTLSIPDFMRGPGQAISAPAIGAGIPISLSNGAGVGSVSFQVRYDPALLTVSDVTLASGLGNGAKLTKDLGAPGVVSVTISGMTGLTAASRVLVTLQAQVPNNAPYAQKQILDIANIKVNGAAGRIDDAGLELVGYLADTTANAAYNTLDVQRMQRVIAQLDSGFSAYHNVDPVVVADTSANGTLNTLDVTFLHRQVAGLAPTQIPANPANIPPIVHGGPDPLVAVPHGLRAAPGQVLTVPVNLDTATGLESAQLRLAYDSSSLEVVDVRKGSLTEDFEWMVRRDEPGVLVVDVAGLNPLPGGSGSLVDVDFRVKPGAAPGGRLLDLQWAQLNDGALTLTPAPVTGQDPTDGTLNVIAAKPLSNGRAGAVGGVMAELASSAPLKTPPAFETAPVIDWAGRGQVNFVVPAVDLGLRDATAQPRWMKDFVTGLGQSDDDRDPNGKIRVTLPLGHGLTKLTHHLSTTANKDSK